MLNISSFLKRFKDLKDPRLEKDEIARVLSQCLGFEINVSQISLKNNVIHFTGNSGVRTEIYLKRELILNTFKEKLPHLHIKDIR